MTRFSRGIEVSGTLSPCSIHDTDEFAEGGKRDLNCRNSFRRREYELDQSPERTGIPDTGIDRVDLAFGD